MILDDVIGPQAGIGDRLGGAALGAVRVGLIAITVVLIFDQLVPTNLQPAFMTGSRLRPMLSAAGQLGVKSLPPDLDGYDRPPEERPAHIIGYIGVVSLLCISAVAAPLSGPLDLATVAFIRLSENHLT